MTQNRARLSSDKVGGLEHQLADAAAEVASVQAELQQAQRADDPPPPGAELPRFDIPADAVRRRGRRPHVITVDGSSGAAAATSPRRCSGSGQAVAAAVGAEPVVMVDGQTVSSKPLDTQRTSRPR